MWANCEKRSKDFLAVVVVKVYKDSSVGSASGVCSDCDLNTSCLCLVAGDVLDDGDLDGWLRKVVHCVDAEESIVAHGSVLVAPSRSGKRQVKVQVDLVDDCVIALAARKVSFKHCRD